MNMKISIAVMTTLLELGVHQSVMAGTNLFIYDAVGTTPNLTTVETNISADTSGATFDMSASKVTPTLTDYARFSGETNNDLGTGGIGLDYVTKTNTTLTDSGLSVNANQLALYKTTQTVGNNYLNMSGLVIDSTNVTHIGSALYDSSTLEKLTPGVGFDIGVGANGLGTGNYTQTSGQLILDSTAGMNANNGGITNAGAISGVTTLNATGNITTTGSVNASTLNTTGSASIGGNLFVSGALGASSTSTVGSVTTSSGMLSDTYGTSTYTIVNNATTNTLTQSSNSVLNGTVSSSVGTSDNLGNAISSSSITTLADEIKLRSKDNVTGNYSVLDLSSTGTDTSKGNPFTGTAGTTLLYGSSAVVSGATQYSVTGMTATGTNLEIGKFNYSSVDSHGTPTGPVTLIGMTMSNSGTNMSGQLILDSTAGMNANGGSISGVNTLTATGNITTTASVNALTLNSSGDTNVGGNLSVSGNTALTGNLTVAGTTTFSSTPTFSNGLTVTSGVASFQSGASVAGGNLNMNNNRVTNVGAGVSGTDAVNMNQLNGVSQQLNNVSQKAYAGTANVAAIAGIPALQSDKHFNLGIGYGNYQGENAFALGGNVRLSENIVAKASFGISNADVTSSVGVGIAF